MRLIVGLGNPGRQYEPTRHNVGFTVLDRVARRHAAGVIARSKFPGAVLAASIEGEQAMLLKPTTFMNRAGQSVSEAVRFYRLDPTSDLLILVDDTALSCGIIRLRSGGGAGGHNGLADVERMLATDQYARPRVILVDGNALLYRAYYALPGKERLRPALEPREALGVAASP